MSLESGGGLLDDGYAMGRTFREKSTMTVIENGSACASSCAVAFLGGTRRVVEKSGQVMFHAPYYKKIDSTGEQKADCDVGDASLEELMAYYIDMVGEKAGNRLFERTMSYCSADDGWVVQGGSAAELFSIATEK